MCVAGVEALLALTGRAPRARPVATVPWLAVASCACAGTRANPSTGFARWSPWPAPPRAAKGPRWPCGPLGTIGIDRERTVGSLRTRTVRAVGTPRPVRRRPVGARRAIALGGAGSTSSVVFAMRGPAGARGRASWSPWAALIVAAPVGAAVAPLWPGAGTPAGKLRSDPCSDWPFDELDAVRVRTLLDNTWRLDGNHGYAFDAELRLGAHYVACFCPAIKKSSVERTARVKCARGTPSPSAVGPRACELDLYAAGHRTKVQLRRRSANHGPPSREDANLSQ